MAPDVLTDPAAIVRELDAALLADPVRNTVLGSVRALVRGAGTGGWCARAGAALAVRSRPADPVTVTDGWEDAGALAGAVAALPELAGLGGPPATVDVVVAALGRVPELRREERLYRLDRLVPPTGVPGRARPASAGDVDLVASWIVPYGIETAGPRLAVRDAQAWAATAVADRDVWLWLDRRERPVSMAAVRPPAAGVSRIGPVYTPPPSRRHGYGSAVTAAAAQHALDHLAVPVLFADLANPTSNAIYRSIGFRPVTDRLAVVFRPLTGRRSAAR